MPRIDILKSSSVKDTSRLKQLKGVFDIQPSTDLTERWQFDVEFPEGWQIGAIIGPSGSGKTTIAKELFGELFTAPDWPHDKSLVDGFPNDLSIKAITHALNSVGFGSVPQWIRPYHVLSMGQQFRANLAYALASDNPLIVFDEFTSVVDRTVAQIGSAAVAKAIRKTPKRFVAVSCHYDVLDWLEPDWVLEPHTGRLLTQKEGLWRRPKLELEVRRVHRSAWEIFRPYHYLNHTFLKSARCFVAFLNGQPVALQAVVHQMHPRSKILYRGHRAVCLPDYQGVGIGGRLIEYVASAYRGMGYRIISATASPTLNHARRNNPNWKLIRAGRQNKKGQTSRMGRLGWKQSADRITATWEYIGPAMPKDQAEEMLYG